MKKIGGKAIAICDKDGRLLYRDFCMGFAMLWIVLFHSGLSFGNIKFFGPFLQVIKNWGYGGVDIFLFLSGFGCYVSLSHNSDIHAFFGRRVSKIMPAYFLFIPFYIAWLFVCAFLTGGQVSWIDILGNILTIGYLAGGENQFINWYLSGLWVCYLLAPYFVSIVKRRDNRLQKVGVFLLVILVSFCWLCKDSLMLWSRLPIFYLGICAAFYMQGKECISVKVTVMSMLVMVVGFLWLAWSYRFHYDALLAYGLYWYPFILITPGFCILLSLMRVGISKIKLAGKVFLSFLDLVGRNTLPIYLIHIFIFYMFEFFQGRGKIPDTNLIWLLAILSVIPATVVFVQIEHAITKKISLHKSARMSPSE